MLVFEHACSHSLFGYIFAYQDVSQYTQNEQKSTKQEYSRDFIAAALMVYCRGCGIPLPKKARKSVVLKGEGIILRVEI